MTDRELLEAAASAYWGGSDVTFRFDQQEQAIVYIDADNQDLNGRDIELLWLPLLDDGDALRLAVKLGIHVSPMIATWWEQDGTEHKFENDASDPLTDTRRSIVRAAAAMAEGKIPFPTAQEIRDSFGYMYACKHGIEGECVLCHEEDREHDAAMAPKG